MKHVIKIIWVVVIIMLFAPLSYAGGDKGDLGLGIRFGLNRLEGDIVNPAIKPFAYGNVNYNINYFVSIGAEGGYSVLEDKDNSSFQTKLIPFELHTTLNFIPLGRVNPYAILGGGGVYWNATINGQTVRYPTSEDELQKGVDSFLKVGGGLELALNKSKKLYLNIGATYRYSLTDMLDIRPYGDENDGLVDINAGLSYFFRTTTRGDKDGDGVPDELDIDINQAEDSDGYMDHDGKPDGVPPLGSVWNKDNETNDSDDTIPPVVIHLPVKKAEAGRDIKINAEIFENKKLKITKIIYRPEGIDKWKLQNLKNLGGILYSGTIPGNFVKKQGLEYCVIAVDEAMSGIGYSGLPKRPIRVEVIGNPIAWRIINSSVALLGWGTASYMLYRKQK